MSRAERRSLVERENRTLPVSKQCRLLAVSRSSVYRRPAEVSEEDRAIMALIDRQYLAQPYYGSRRMAAWLATQGHLVNRKRVQRLMRLMGLVAIYQRPNTSKAAAAHKVYPYLLGGLAIDRVNQVWCSDVAYMCNDNYHDRPATIKVAGFQSRPKPRGGSSAMSSSRSMSSIACKASAAAEALSASGMASSQAAYSA
jgi:putative transposase